MTKILVTGGAGYIGSHTIVELVESGFSIVVVDNLSNSSQESIKRIERMTGKKIPFHKIDLRDSSSLEKIFMLNKFKAIIHFAGSKSVKESVYRPLEYYDNNICSTLSLLKLAIKYKVKKIIFSSSATVYGSPMELPLKETSRVGVGISNPYGQTKFMIEQILKDLSVSDPTLEISILRYFNPIGAHPSGMIGEDPNGTPNNLMPYIAQVAVGKLNYVKIFGNDYKTKDGTGVRDYIHVSDLAKGHVAALEYIKPGVSIYNLGTGRGVSVLDLINAFKKASGKQIPYKFVARRNGDIPECYATPQKAKKELGWTAKKDIYTACRDTWLWQSNNPDGYDQ